MPKSQQPRSAKQTPYPRVTNAAASSSSSSQADTGPVYRFNFGKYRGKTIKEVPWDFVEWCINRGIPNQRPDLKSGIEAFRRSNPNKPLSIKERYERVKCALSDRLWLLRECEAALERYQEERYSGNLERPPFLEREKVEALEQMLREKRQFSKQYPSRTTDRLPESSAVSLLDACLARCPDLNGRLTDEDRELLARNEDGMTLYKLSEQYKQDITACLEEVQKEHGIEARKIANWKVRDTVAQRVKGVKYVGDRWDKWFVDDSVEWLRL